MSASTALFPPWIRLRNGNLSIEYTAARPLYERGLAWSEQAERPSHPSLAPWLDGLGTVLARTGAYAPARGRFARALAIRERAYGADDPSVAQSLNDIALVLMTQHEYAAAAPLLDRAVAIAEQRFAPDQAGLRTLRSNRQSCQAQLKVQQTSSWMNLWQRLRRP